MHLGRRIIGLWDWAGRLQLVAPLIGAPVLAVIYFVYAFMQEVPLPFLIPLALWVLAGSLIVIRIAIAIYDRFKIRSSLEVFVDPKNSWFWESAQNPHSYAADEEKYGEFYKVEVVNHGAQTIEGISVVYWYDGETNHHRAFGTDKTTVSLDPDGRKFVKMFFRSHQDYIGDGETADPSPFDISVKATAKNALSSPTLRLHFEPTFAGVNDDKPIFRVSVR